MFGALSGAAVFGLLEPKISKSIFGKGGEYLTLNSMWDQPFLWVAIPYIAALGGALYLLESLHPGSVKHCSVVRLDLFKLIRLSSLFL